MTAAAGGTTARGAAEASAAAGAATAAGGRVVVTAGAGGIGAAIAQAFVAVGARVHVCDVDEDALRAATRARPEITASVCDVSDHSSVERFVADAAETPA